MESVVLMLAAAALSSSRQASASPVTANVNLGASTSSSGGFVLGKLALDPQDPTMPFRPAFWDRLQSHHDNLKPCKKIKGLLTRDYYNRMLVVMLDPENTANEDAQFRHWIRENFDFDSRSRIVQHRKPVAVWEDFYDILVDAHKRAKHGGRDKTWKVLSKKWGKLPKELVTQFVELCPTCAPKKTNINRAPRKPKLLASDDDASDAPLAPRAMRRSNKQKSYVDMGDSDDEAVEPFVEQSEADDEDYMPESGLDQVARAAQEVLADLPPPLSSDMEASSESAVLPDPPFAHSPSDHGLSPTFSSSEGSTSNESPAPPTPCAPLHALPFQHFPLLPYNAYSSGSNGSWYELGRHNVMANDTSGAAYDPYSALFAPPAAPAVKVDSPALEISDFIHIFDEEVAVESAPTRESPTTLRAAATLAALDYEYAGAASPNPPSRMASLSSLSAHASASPFPTASSSDGGSGKSSRARTSNARDDDDDNVVFPPAKKACFA
ncbi:hypothetical protein JCM11251_001764 [Rhodosporidiobolus azoricus]